MLSKNYIFLFCFITLLYYSCNDVKYAHGKRSYNNFCSDCHMEDGSGVADLYPTLKSASVVQKYREIPCIIRHGIYNDSSLIKMPSIPKLSNVDITNIINYITHDMNLHHKEELLLSEVDELLAKCPLE